MKTKILLIALLAIGLTSTTNAQPNTSAGTVVGAVAGALIGANNHAPIGGAIAGAIIGGAIGNAVDQSQGQYPQPVYTYGPINPYDGYPTYVIVQSWNGATWVQTTYPYNGFVSWHYNYWHRPFTWNGPRYHSYYGANHYDNRRYENRRQEAPRQENRRQEAPRQDNRHRR